MKTSFPEFASQNQEKMSSSKEYSAVAGGENLFTQPQIINWREAPKKDFLHTAGTHPKYYFPGRWPAK